jgi:hypothetical protein
MRRTYREALLSVGTLAILILVLTAFDDRVRDHVSLRVMTHPTAGAAATVGHELRDLTSVIVQAARDQSVGHAPLLIFALVSAVLLLFMLRT